MQLVSHCWLLVLLTDQKNKELRSVNILAGTVTLNKPTAENAVEQITKADRDACHALCEKAKPAPRYGGLVPPLCAWTFLTKKKNFTDSIKSGEESSMTLK